MPGPLQRPKQLRGLASSWGYKMFSIVGVMTFASFLAFRYGFWLPRAKKFEDFFATVDPYKMLESICEKDAMMSCPRNLQKRLEEQ